MVVDGCWAEEREGDGDLGGLFGSGGASTGGSSTAIVVLCEGVWLLDKACVTVGDTAASKSVPAHRTEGNNPGRSYWARTQKTTAHSKLQRRKIIIHG